jgi:hypothetical protein
MVNLHAVMNIVSTPQKVFAVFTRSQTTAIKQDFDSFAFLIAIGLVDRLSTI